MNLAWYVLQVATNMEDKVQGIIAANITKKIKEFENKNNIQEAKSIKRSFGIDQNLNNTIEIEEFLKTKVILVPKEKVEEIKNGKKRETDRKIFPGYILINMDYSDEIGLLIRKTFRVSGFVGGIKDAKPVPISQKEVDSIVHQIENSKQQAKHKIEFEVGEKIRVIDGPFVDFNAIIEDVIYNKTKLKVNVQIFGRDTTVELDFGQVEKI